VLSALPGPFFAAASKKEAFKHKVNYGRAAITLGIGHILVIWVMA